MLNKKKTKRWIFTVVQGKTNMDGRETGCDSTEVVYLGAQKRETWCNEGAHRRERLGALKVQDSYMRGFI